MAIDMDLVELRLSVAAGAGNTTPGSAASSFGDQVSTTDVESGDLNNLWPDVSSAVAAAGAVDYRCVFLANTDTETLIGAQVSLTGQVSGGSTLAIGLDPIGVTALGSASPQATTIASGAIAPAGVSFSTGPLSIGDLDAAEAVAVWVRRTTLAGAVPTTDAATLLLAGDSMP